MTFHRVLEFLALHHKNILNTYKLKSCVLHLACLTITPMTQLWSLLQLEKTHENAAVLQLNAELTNGQA